MSADETETISQIATRVATRNPSWSAESQLKQLTDAAIEDLEWDFEYHMKRWNDKRLTPVELALCLYVSLTDVEASIASAEKRYGPLKAPEAS